MAPHGLLSPEWKVFLRMLLEPTEIYSVFHLTLKCYTKFHKTKHYSNEFISTYSFIVLLFSCCWLWFFNNCKRTWVHHHEKGNRYLNQVYFFNVLYALRYNKISHRSIKSNIFYILTSFQVAFQYCLSIYIRLYEVRYMWL